MANDEQTPMINAPVQAVAPQVLDLHGIPHITMPPEWQAVSGEELLAKPNRIKERVFLDDLTSFIEYVNRFKRKQSVVFLATGKGSVSAMAVIDYHEPGPKGAAWGSHQVIFNARWTSAWKAWESHDGSVMRQRDFAHFIHKNSADIHEPKGAQLLEIVKTLKATAKGEFRDMKDLATGSMELIYRMQVSARGGTTDQPVSLPEAMTLWFVPFFGAEHIRLWAEIIIDTPRSDAAPLQLGYRLYRPDLALEGLAARTSDRLKELTGLPVYRCPKLERS